MQSFRNALYTFVLLIIFTAIAYIFYALTDNTTNVAIIYILYVLLVARLTSGYACGLLASVFGVIGVNYFFTYPFLQLNFTISGYPVTFMGMLCISVITSTLTTHIKEQARIASEREEALHTLNEVSKKLIRAEGQDEIIQLILNFSSCFTHSSAVFYHGDPADTLPFKGYYTNKADEPSLITPYERAAAHEAYVTDQLVLPMAISDAAAGLYIPIVSHNETWGVLGLYNATEALYDTDFLSFLNLLIPEISLAFERQSLSDAHRQLAVESEKEKTRANLLRAVSHDLRTPLTSMIGASSTYLENGSQLTSHDKKQLVSHIYEDANWLLHMVENLLSVTRINEDSTKVKKTLEPLEEVIAESISRVKKRLPQGRIEVSVPEEFIMVPMDSTLIEQVIINLLENAIKYSHTASPILLKAEKKQSDTDGTFYIEIQVIDHGIGIPKEKLSLIFDGYNLASSPSCDTSKGMGIGLSICKTIIMAHGGQIKAENQTQGIAFIFTLPLQGDDQVEK